MKIARDILKVAASFLPLVLFIVSMPGLMAQQWNDNFEISFGTRSWDPVKIKTEEKPTSTSEFPTIRFTAFNSTYYPFVLKIDFDLFENLYPRPAVRPFTVMHGPTSLYSFTGHVPGKGYGYRYSYLYWLSPSREASDGSFPYLIPLAEGQVVSAGVENSQKLRDSFSGRAGDTVFCMRRGLVTAVPRDKNLDFRLSPHDCLEVMHDDFTYMVYENISAKDILMAPGQTVLPGQPLAVFSDKGYLEVTLLKIKDNSNTVETLPVGYVTDGGEVVDFSQIDGRGKSVHPLSVIVLEMKSGEKKKAEKARKK